MKPKIFSKKLNLNKKTIAHLKGNEMKEAHGGVITITVRCCLTFLPPGVSLPPNICECETGLLA